MYVFCFDSQIIFRFRLQLKAMTINDQDLFYLSAIITILHVDSLIIEDDCRFNGNTSPYELSAWVVEQSENWLCFVYYLYILFIHVTINVAVITEILMID